MVKASSLHWSFTLSLSLLLVLSTGCGEEESDDLLYPVPAAPKIHQHDPARLDDEWGPDALFNGIYIEWDANEEEALDGYRIYRSTTSDGPFESIDEVSKSATFYEDTSVRRETRYHYRVSAFNTEGTESPLSEIVSYTLLPVAVPVNPSNHAVLDSPEVRFDWIPVGGAGWYLLRVELNTNDPELLWQPVWISAPIYSFDDFNVPYDSDGLATSGLETDQEYRWRVDVVGDRTVGSESDWRYFTTEFE